MPAEILFWQSLWLDDYPSPVPENSDSEKDIRVSIVEDDAGVRESLADLIGHVPGLICVGAHPDAESALREIAGERPDVVLMDINLPRMSGIQCARKLKAIEGAPQVLMLTMYEDSEQVFQSLRAGASGYLLKRSSPDEIVQAIRDVAAGGAPMSRQVARKVVGYFQGIDQPRSEMDKLTPREYEVLTLLAKGFFYKEIAEQTGITLETVRGHLHNIYRKLHVQSRTEAVVRFLGH
jgi:DNA-binding NarL/FixJ family response regulator